MGNGIASEGVDLGVVALLVPCGIGELSRLLVVGRFDRTAGIYPLSSELICGLGC